MPAASANPSPNSRRWLRLTSAAVALSLVSAITLNVAAQQRRPRGQKPRETSKLFEGTPPHHVGDYPAFNIVWQPEERLQDVRAVFPNPIVSQQIAVVTGAGLQLSNDTGKTWNMLPGTAPDAIGDICHIEFAADGSLYLASATKGVWRITDPAKAPQQIASKSIGLLSDAVTQIRVDTGDPSGKTLLAVHGSDAAGISRSQDAGRTWKPIPGLDEYFIDKLLCGGPGVSWAFALAAQKDPTGPRRIFFCLAVGDFFKDYAGDVQATDGAVELLFDKPFPEASDLSYWSTADSGLLHISHDGTSSQRIGPQDIDKWSCIGITYGPTADSRLLYAYNPAKLGFAVSQDNGQTFTPFSQGLPTGGFVKQGAHIRANAGGSVFFAAINNNLYIGRRHTGAITISDIRVTPAALSYAPTRYGEAFNDLRNQLANFRATRTAAEGAPDVVNAYRQFQSSANDVAFTITARLVDPDDDSNEGAKAPIAVTVDLSRVGGSPVTPMYDDGLHGDGAPNDGVYGATCMLRPDRLRNHYQDRRRPSPGPMPLTITAVSPEGALSIAVGVFDLLERVETHAYWVPTARNDWKDATGDLAIAPDDYRVPGDKKGLKFTTQGKPWSLPLVNYYDHSVVGYDSLSFDIKTDGPAPKELYVQLRDSSPDTVPASTVHVPVISEGLVQGGSINKELHRVTIPFARLLKDPPDDSPRFRPAMLHCVVISSDDASQKQNYWIGPLRFHVAGEGGDVSKTGGGVQP